jgi:UDP-glucose 4-epimerase
MTRLAWVIGANGLLGSAVVREIAGRPDWDLFPAASLPWLSPDDFAATARTSIRELLAAAAARGATWSIVWAAGAVVTSSLPAEFDGERNQLRGFLDILREEAAGSSAFGNVFFASSAGGVYAGSVDPPFTEDTEAAPLAPYGWFKLEMEAEMRRFAAASGIPVLIGRIANLYGPGQRLNKMQGLISHLALARFAAKPVFIFVPLETVRDYIFVDDCAAKVLDSLDRLALEGLSLPTPPVVIKILGSGEGISISTLLGYYRAITKSMPRVVLGTSPSTKFQAVDLRMRSTIWPDLDRRERTPVSAGFHATMMDVLRLLQL